ncbi:MAG TPA: ABC transporter ATP-binding protein [Puia sp.]|nr:ABC transporter ATP-binding protein [Puia sp.]
MAVTNTLVEVKNISRKYFLDDTEIFALDNVSCSIGKGDFLAIAGPSGSGKTTLLNIIGCIDKPTQGDIFFEGINITNTSLDKLNHLRLHHIGFVFQTFNLVPVLTAYENVELPLLFKGLDKRTINELVGQFLLRVGIADKMNQRPSNMSGGQRQRLAIARALAGNPSLIVADEPTASLDRKNAESIIELMKELNAELGITVVIASHDQMVIDHARTKLFIQDGKIVK